MAEPSASGTTGQVLLLAAICAAPWPYGSVGDVWRHSLAAVVLLAAGLIALRCGVTRDLAAVAPLALVPLLQIAARTATPAEALDAAPALWSALACWLALRAGAGTRTAAAAVAGTALLQAAFGLVQASLAPHTLYGRSTPWMTSSFGSFMNHNHFAGYAELGTLLSLGLCAEQWRRRREAVALLWAGAAGLLLLAHLASRSRGGVLALAAGLAAFAWRLAGRSRARALLALLGAALALASAVAILPDDARARLLTMASGHDGSGAYRLHLAAASLRLAAAHPLLGCGLGGFADAVTAHKRGFGDVRATHAENDVLQFAAEAGLLGLAALAFAAVRLLPAARRARGAPLASGAVAALVALGVHSLLDFNLRVPATALAAAVCLAVALPRRRAEGREPPPAARFLLAGLLGALALASAARAVGAFEHTRAAAVADPFARATALSHALVWNPLEAAVHRDRARAWAQAADGALREVRLARAAEDYRGALERRPRWAEVWYELAWVEVARGRCSSAEVALRRARDLDPGSIPLGRGVDELRAALGRLGLAGCREP